MANAPRRSSRRAAGCFACTRRRRRTNPIRKKTAQPATQVDGGRWAAGVPFVVRAAESNSGSASGAPIRGAINDCAGPIAGTATPVWPTSHRCDLLTTLVWSSTTPRRCEATAWARPSACSTPQTAADQHDLQRLLRDPIVRLRTVYAVTIIATGIQKFRRAMHCLDIGLAAPRRAGRTPVPHCQGRRSDAEDQGTAPKSYAGRLARLSHAAVSTTCSASGVGCNDSSARIRASSRMNGALNW